MGIKQWTVVKSVQEQIENVCTRGTSPTLVPQYKVCIQAPAPLMPEFWRGHLWCVHISAQRESCSGTKCENSLGVSFYLG